ncbi:MAG: amino acid permease [Pseudomonadota bacterium]
MAVDTSPDSQADPQAPGLRRAVTLPMLVLYGLGVTIGAGIYVLVGATAGKAGLFAPSAFVLSALVMAFSAASFAEFVGRVPRSAGEAAYVRTAYRQNWLATLTGALVIFGAIIATSAIALGCAGYIGTLVDLPQPVLVIGVIILMGALAAWGIQESVTVAAVLTLIEIAGLLVIIGAGFVNDPGMLGNIEASFPSFSDSTAMLAVLSASLIAFFAFIGFDSMVNLAEEVPNPRRAMPLAIVLSLVLVTILYFLLVFVALNSVEVEDLAGSSAPVGLLFERLTGMSPFAITLIAIMATANGIVIEIIMATRVVYGLSAPEQLDVPWFARVNARTRTPLNATIVITALVILFALLAPLDVLAEATSQIFLTVFILVNTGLIIVKLRGDAAPEGTFVVPLIIPVIGAATCLLLLVSPLLTS